MVGTPAPSNASRRISNSLQVGTSRQSTIAMVGGFARAAPLAVARDERVEHRLDRRR